MSDCGDCDCGDCSCECCDCTCNTCDCIDKDCCTCCIDLFSDCCYILCQQICDKFCNIFCNCCIECSTNLFSCCCDDCCESNQNKDKNKKNQPTSAGGSSDLSPIVDQPRIELKNVLFDDLKDDKNNLDIDLKPATDQSLNLVSSK